MRKFDRSKFTPEQLAVMEGETRFVYGHTTHDHIKVVERGIRRSTGKAVPVTFLVFPSEERETVGNLTGPKYSRAEASWEGGSGSSGWHERPLDAMVEALKTYFQPA